MKTESLARQVTASKWIVVLAMIVAISLYCFEFGWFSLTDSREAWGQFGDFFGGVLNPVISAAAFYWLATSILLQKAELSETRDALRLTQDAQQQQADTALIAAKIQRDNIWLTLVGNKISLLRTRQTYLMQLQAERGPASMFFDENGVHREIQDALKDLNIDINAVELEEAEVIGKIDKQAEEFRAEVATGYANHPPPREA